MARFASITDISSETLAASLPSAPSSLSPSSPDTNNASRSEKKKRSSRRRCIKETIVSTFVIAFVLNALNGRKIIQSVNTQFEELSGMIYYSSPTMSSTQQASENKTEDTAIIITSSYIPTHPSTYMVESVLNSTLDHIIGLSATAPIFITIDHFRFSDFQGLPPVLQKRINDVEQYQVNLLNKYLTNPRIHIVQAAKFSHIGGSVLKALNLIERHYPTVRYAYYLQHDFFFFKDIDHAALVNVMDENPKINYVRFPKKDPWQMIRQCGDETAILYNETYVANNGTAPRARALHPTSDYSDNNHLVRFDWYKPTIASMGIKMTRAPENPLQKRANMGCVHKTPRADDITGLYLYHERSIGHLNGRRTVGAPP